MWDSNIDSILSRHVRGSPLHTLGLTGNQIDCVARSLATYVAHWGLAGLRRSGPARALVVLGAEHLATEARRLEWAPVLERAGVPEGERKDYTELYDPVEAALHSFGRELIVSHGRRMFLATLLREGGLPTHIGNLPDLVQRAVRAVGWARLTGSAGASERAAAVLRIRHGAGRSNVVGFLEHPEGRQALEDLLREAADAREGLIECGVDPTSLSSAEEVERALVAHGVAKPSVRNRDLLNAVLVSITQTDPPSAPEHAKSVDPPRLVLRRRADGVPELRVAADLKLLGVVDGIPEGVSHVAVRLEPDAAEGVQSRVAIRDGSGEFKTGTGAHFVEWSIRPVQGTRTVITRFAGVDGEACSVPIADLTWPDEDLVWFDESGDLIAESRETLQPGETLTLLTKSAASVEGSGCIELSPMTAPRPFTAAWSVAATGKGRLRVSSNGATQSLTASEQRLTVTVESSAPAPWSQSPRVVLELPTLQVPDGVSLEARVGGSREYVVIQSGLHGRVHLSRLRALAQSSGEVSVRIRGNDGATWAATWWVLPRQLRVVRRTGQISVEVPSGCHVSSCSGDAVQTDGGCWHVAMRPEAAEAMILLTLPNGDSIRLTVPALSTIVRLCTSDRTPLPTDGSTTLTESLIAAGAYLEVRASAKSQIVLEARNRKIITRWLADQTGRVSVPLREVVSYLTRAAESQVDVLVGVDGVDTGCCFTVHVPRLAKPNRLHTDRSRLRVAVDLDPSDLPRTAGLALFDVVHPFRSPAICSCSVSEIDDGRYEVSALPAQLPTSRSRWIGFLVDQERIPARPMSGGVLLDLPLAHDELPPPQLSSALQSALWSGDVHDIAEALSPSGRHVATIRSFVSRLVATAPERIRFGIRWFKLFDLAAVRAPWLLLAAGTELDLERHQLWVADYIDGASNFSWLRLRRSDAITLRAVAGPLPPARRMALVGAARAAARMPTAVELMLLEELFNGPEAAVVEGIARQALNVAPSTQPLTNWNVVALPQGGRLGRWLRGGPVEDASDLVPQLKSRQVARAGRLEGIRSLFAKLQLAGGDVSMLGRGAPVLQGNERQRPRWLAFLRERVRSEWAQRIARQAQGIDPLERVAALELAVLEAAASCTEYRERQRKLSEIEWREVIALERMTPGLFDAWLSIIQLAMRNEGGADGPVST